MVCWSVLCSLTALSLSLRTTCSSSNTACVHWNQCIGISVSTYQNQCIGITALESVYRRIGINVSMYWYRNQCIGISARGLPQYRTPAGQQWKQISSVHRTLRTALEHNSHTKHYYIHMYGSIIVLYHTFTCMVVLYHTFTCMVLHVQCRQHARWERVD